MNRSVALLLVTAVTVVAGAGGCGAKRPLPDPAYFVKPTIAVMKFDNRAPFPLKWDLGGGMADMLVDRLMASGRYRVIERRELPAVLGEIDFQSSGLTREQERVLRGQIKNVQYLVKGTVTDFGHVSRASGFLGGWGTWLGGSRAEAIMGMTIYVVHVQSGEIVSSESLEESVSANTVEIEGRYDDVAFGGSVFYRTPLGRATAAVMDRSVRTISERVALARWHPRIAAVRDDGSLVLSGGSDRRIRKADEFRVVSQGLPVKDPRTGDLLGHLPGKVIGTVEVTAVYPRYSLATVKTGSGDRMKVGLTCRGSARPRARSSVSPTQRRRRRY